jgi:hypothetical protein
MDKVSPKFKSGDNLRCVDNTNSYLTLDKIYTCKYDSYYNSFLDIELVTIMNDEGFLSDYCVEKFEKIQEPENFQPGDMVGCIDDCGCLDIKKGKIYKILKNEGRYIYVDTDTNDTSPYMDKRFKKIDNFTKQAIAAEEKHPLNSIGPLPEVYTQNGQVIIKIQGNVEILVPMGMTINLNTNGDKAWVCLIP